MRDSDEAKVVDPIARGWPPEPAVGRSGAALDPHGKLGDLVSVTGVVAGLTTRPGRYTEAVLLHHHLRGRRHARRTTTGATRGFRPATGLVRALAGLRSALARHRPEHTLPGPLDLTTP
jgi:hypothetical protein